MDIYASVQRQKFIAPSEKILVGVSGGADSMCLVYCLFLYFQQQKRNLTDMIVCSLDHRVRTASHNEVEMVREWCQERCISFVTKYRDEEQGEKDEGKPRSLSVPPPLSARTEAVLRQRRHQQFLFFAKEVGAKKLFLGHNLTDRVETTLLNLCRGCSWEGFLGMQPMQDHFLDSSVSICRPLLSFAKDAITAFCIEKNIPYVTDPSNFDAATSQRNSIRNSILPQLFALGHQRNDGEAVFLRSMQNIYKSQENVSKQMDILVGNKDVKLGGEKDVKYYVPTEILLHPAWEAERGYLLSSKITIENFVFLAKQLCFYKNVSRRVLVEIVGFLQTASSGYKWRNGVYFFVCHGKIYCIKAKKEFWLAKTDDREYAEKTYLSDQEMLSLSSLYVFPAKDVLPANCAFRYLLAGDRFHGKTCNNRLTNQKIPVFWRPWCLVCVSVGSIVHVLVPKNFLEYGH